MSAHTHHVTVGANRVRKQFTSWHDGEADREWACLTLLYEHAPGLAPRPLDRTVVDDAPVIIMERLPGTPLGPAPLTEEQHGCLGAALRRLYGVPLDAILKADLKERRLGPNLLVQHLRDAFQQVEVIPRCTDRAAVEEAVTWGRSFTAVALDGRETILPVMGIADLNPANVLWDGTACRLVDFEDGGRTKREFDLADHVEHIAARSHRVYDATLLARAIALTVDELRSFSTYRMLWALYWLHALLPGNSAYLRNPSGVLESQAHHVLELAVDSAVSDRCTPALSPDRPNSSVAKCDPRGSGNR